eukprot:scaffold3311_cov411-Prasinococcus_capsulatus_cf.AAC.16
MQELDSPEIQQQHEDCLISQAEYVTRLRRLRDDLAAAWQNAERVTALKLSIKVAHLLQDTSVPQFYPILFVLVADALDTMGALVYQRILLKCEKEDDGTAVCSLPTSFTCDDVRNQAKETCSNWFTKVGSIFDLPTRLYMELSLFPCYRFLEAMPPVQQIERLVKMTRGWQSALQRRNDREAKCVQHPGCRSCGPTCKLLSSILPGPYD